MATARYVLEATWNGYRSGQERVCHREIITTSLPALYKRVTWVPFSDGTGMSITFRKALPREKVQQNLSYREMINDAVFAGQTHESIKALRKAQRSAA